MAILLSMFIVGSILILYSLVNGLVMSLLWAWFMVPIFHLPALTIPGAIGVSLLISYCTYEGRKDDTATMHDHLSRLVAKPLCGLLVGWIVHLFL